MGLKKFRASLLWSKKEKKNSHDVVLLRYNAYSEWEHVSSDTVHATSNDVATRLHTFESKQPPLFENVSAASTETQLHENKLTEVTELKGILKYSKNTAPKVTGNNKNFLPKNKTNNDQSSVEGKNIYSNEIYNNEEQKSAPRIRRVSLAP